MHKTRGFHFSYIKSPHAPAIRSLGPCHYRSKEIVNYVANSDGAPFPRDNERTCNKRGFDAVGVLQPKSTVLTRKKKLIKI